MTWHVYIQSLTIIRGSMCYPPKQTHSLIHLAHFPALPHTSHTLSHSGGVWAPPPPGMPCQAVGPCLGPPIGESGGGPRGQGGGRGGSAGEGILQKNVFYPHTQSKDHYVPFRPTSFLTLNSFLLC